MIQSLIEVDTAFPWFFPMMVSVFGACVGSFLNVVIYRVPAGRSVVFPGSTCACGKPIVWYDNIPILSWFLLRGRARCCGARFSFRYAAVELLVAFLFWAAWETHAPLPALAVMIAIGLFVAGSFIDLDTMEIPDVFTIGGFIIGVFLSLMLPALHGFESNESLVNGLLGVIESLKGAFIGSGLILWFALIAETILRREAMGMGDVKLMGAIGAFFGWQGAVFALFGGAVIGTVVFLPILFIFGKKSPREERTEPTENEETDEDDEESTAGRIPFGPALAAGALVYALWLHPAVDAYFADFAAVLFLQ